MHQTNNNTQGLIVPAPIIAPRPRGFQLAEGDIEILKLLFEYRVLRIDHLIALTGRRQQMLNRRIVKLLERRFISRIVLPQQKHLYLLGREALPVLTKQGIAKAEEIEWRIRNQDLKPLFLEHLLMIVGMHVSLSLALHASPIRLIAWKQGTELHDSVTLYQSGEKQYFPVCPDAFFTLENTRRPAGQNRAHFFLEADRSTTTHERFQKKLSGYWHYFQKGLHTKKYSIPTFRVVTVTLTKERAANLCRLTQAVIPRPESKYYLFTSLKHFSLEHPHTLLEDIFSVPHDDRLYRLVPRLEPSPASV